MIHDSIVVFAPHPDDETLGCGGTIAKRVNEGYEVTLALMTDGRFAFRGQGILSDPSPREVKDIRREEFQRAAKILGVNEHNLFYLDFEDGSLALNEKAAEEKVLLILRKKLPAQVYFPSANDSHSDHKATNRIVQKAISKSGQKIAMYEYSSRSQMLGSLAFACNARVLSVDISAFLDLKKAALKEHKSQFTIISNKQKRPVMNLALVSNIFKTHEFLHEVGQSAR
jgi:LmbE family N-acetylglucosaminyl deacetylase